MRKKTCFVLMPFGEEYNNPWEFAIKPAAEENDLCPFRGDDSRFAGGVIPKDITRSIMDADIIVAEITGQNPNVMYELGLAHAAKKKIIMIVQSEEGVPFDIKHIRHVLYSKNQLTSLREKLTEEIYNLRRKVSSDFHDFFPELTVLTKEKKEEIRGLKEKNHELISMANGLCVKVKPTYAYIFFNNRYVGLSPQTIHVNPYHERNVLTVYAPGHFEEYHEVNEKDLDDRCIDIVLSPRTKEGYLERMYGWLRYVRLCPDDIVISLAIIQYLNSVGKFVEARKELDGLLEISQWSMIYNALGVSYAKEGNYEKALEFYGKVKGLEDTYIGGYNMACTYSRMGEYDKCLSEVREILENDAYLEQLVQVNMQKGNPFLADEAFESIREDFDTKNVFFKLVESLT